MRLEKIPADEFAAFIDARFARSGISAGAGLGAAIVDLAGNLPYDVQRLAHETWDDVRGRRRGGARRSTICTRRCRRLLAEQQMMFEALWQRLTLAQRAVLRAVVLEDGRELLSADVRARHRLGGPSTRAGRARRAASATTSSRATATATSSSTRCCASGSRGGRSREYPSRGFTEA